MKPSRLYSWRLPAALALVGALLAIFASISANAQSIQWFSADVGAPTLAGSATQNGDGTVTIVGGGDDIWNAADNCHYYYAWGSGTTWDAIVEVTAFDGPDYWSKCELMVRAANPAVGPTGPDAFLAFMTCQKTIHNDGTTAAENATIDQFRTRSGANANWQQAGNNPVPVYPGTWMGIHRNGSVFSLYYFFGTTNPGNNFAVNWTHYFDIDTTSTTLVGGDANGNPAFGPTPFPDIVAVGVAVTAHNNGDAVGAIATIANLSVTFPATQPPTAVGVSQPIQGKATNVLGGEVSLSFVATNNAVPATIATVYQWYKNGVAVPGATNSFHTWLLDASDDTAQYYCKAGCPPPYTAVAQAQSGTVTAKVLAGTKYSNGFRIEKFTSTGVSRVGVEQGNVPPATLIDLVPNTDSPGGLGNDYVTRVSGWFVAPTSDNYVFFLSTDDDTDLFLSTDDKIANKKMIAQETSWSNADMWFTSGGASDTTKKRSDQFVDPSGVAPGLIPLVAGHSYYFEEVHHQGGGGDCFTVTYQTATMMSSPTWATDFIDGTKSLIYAASNCMSYASIPATTLTWVSQPTNTQATAGFPAKFYAQAVSDSEFSVKYQWYPGAPGTGTLIAGATAANFASANTTAADDGASFYVVVSTAENEFTLTSVTATVQVGLPVIEKGWALDEYWYTLNPGIAAFRTTITNNGVPYAALGSYANGPDHSIAQPRLEGNSHGDAGSDFTEKVSTLFYPPTTANYVFFVNSDDDSDLYVSTDATAAKAVMVAQETAWGNSWQWQGDLGAAAGNPQKCSSTWVDNVTASGNSPWVNGIPMTAGQPYYIAAVHHEGGGGDNIEATFMTMAEYTASQNVGPANGQYSRFTGNLIATYVPRAFQANFTQQPGTVNVALGGVASLTAVGSTDSLTPVGDNNDPRPEWNNFMVYQWLRDGIPIAGAVSSTYAFGPASPADSAIQFVCTCRAVGYTDNSGNPLWKTSSVANIVVTGTPVFEPGFAVHEFWAANPGRTAIENNAAGKPDWIMAVPGFADNDAGASFIDNYSDELVGFFVPPTTGNYVFFINSDDDGDLFLGTGASASSRRLIAQETGAAGGALQWGTGNVAQNRSDTFVDPATGTTPYASGIPLVAGQKYFLQSVHHEATGGDYNCVTYTMIGDATPANGTVSAIRGAKQGTYVPKCTFVDVTTQPQSVTLDNYVSTTFTASGATDATVPIGSEGDWRPFMNNYLQFQWYKNGAALAGATTSAYAIPQVLPTDNGAQIFCAMRALGYADATGNALWKTSTVATLTVNTTAPHLTYAANYLNTNYLVFGYSATNYITIAFSNPMDPTGLKNPANYTLPAGVTLLDIIVNSNDFRSVALAVSGTLTLPVNISVNAAMVGLGGGLPLSGSTTVAVKSVQLTDGDIGGVPGQDPAWPGMMYVTGTNGYTIACEGSDIWGVADGFNFAWERKTGDFDVVVRQKTIKHTSNWAKGGLMVRETLAAGSRNWNIVNDPLSSDGIQAPDGSGTGASAVECNARYTNDLDSVGWIGTVAGPAPAFPNAWVRIARKGSVLTAYSSSDGATWVARCTNDTAVIPAGSAVALPATVYVGICSTAHNNDPVGSTLEQLRFLNTMDYDNYNSSYVYVPVTVGPTMTATKSGANLIISWAPTGGTLLSSPKVGAGAVWAAVPGATSPYTAPITSSPQFFRVQE